MNYVTKWNKKKETEGLILDTIGLCVGAPLESIYVREVRVIINACEAELADFRRLVRPKAVLIFYNLFLQSISTIYLQLLLFITPF